MVEKVLFEFEKYQDMIKYAAVVNEIVEAIDLTFWEKDKRGRWVSLRLVLSHKNTAATIIVSGSIGKTLSAGIEDFHFTIINESLAIKVQEEIGELDL